MKWALVTLVVVVIIIVGLKIGGRRKDVRDRERN
jgi:hypothetical protein